MVNVRIKLTHSSWAGAKTELGNIPLAFDGECKADFWLLQCGIAPNLIL